MGYDLTKCRQKISGDNGKRLPPERIAAWVEATFDCKPRKGGDELRICNPFNGDASYKFNINPEKGVAHCWTGDEWAGPVNPATGKRNCSFIKFVKLYLKCSYAEAVRAVLGNGTDLKTYLRPENRHSTSEPVKKIAVALPNGTEKLAGSEDVQAGMLIKWLKARGYDDQGIDRHDLHFLGMECYWPYYEFDILVYWQSRNRFNKVYRFPDVTVYEGTNLLGETEGSKGDFLYGFDDCDSATYVTITESIFGQYTLGEQALASGGAALTESQRDKLKIIGPRKGIILSPDNDVAGISSILANAAMLAQLGYPIYFTIPPKLPYEKDGKRKTVKDWNELITELKMSRSEVRAVHDKGIQKASTLNLHRLIGSLTPKDRQKLVGASLV